MGMLARRRWKLSTLETSPDLPSPARITWRRTFPRPSGFATFPPPVSKPPAPRAGRPSSTHFPQIASGVYDCVLVAGVEKMTSQPTARVTEILAGAGDCSGEIKAGSTFPSLFAMIARRHMYEFGTTREHLAAVAVKNHANGALNPDAQYMRKVITMEQALTARPVAEPLHLYVIVRRSATARPPSC